MKIIKKIYISFLQKFDLGSAVAVRLTKLTGKSKIPLHPKHFLTQKPWFTKYIKKQDIVLDLGCGNGQNTIKTAIIAKKVIGIEIDQSLLEIAKNSAININNIKFETANLEGKLKYPNNSFDKILFLDVLEHLIKRDQILKEIRRVLKPNGFMFLGVPNSQTSWKKYQRSAGFRSFSDPGHKIEYSKKSITNILNNHNFEIINFGYGKYDTPLRGLIDIVGVFSLRLYKKISILRSRKVKNNHNEASGFEIVVIKK